MKWLELEIGINSFDSRGALAFLLEATAAAVGWKEKLAQAEAAAHTHTGTMKCNR